MPPTNPSASLSPSDSWNYPLGALTGGHADDDIHRNHSDFGGHTRRMLRHTGPVGRVRGHADDDIQYDHSDIGEHTQRTLRHPCPLGGVCGHADDDILKIIVSFFFNFIHLNIFLISPKWLLRQIVQDTIRAKIARNNLCSAQCAQGEQCYMI